MFWRSFKGDKVIWRIILVLSLSSIAIVFSSISYVAYKSGDSAFSYLLRQAVFVLGGLFVVYFFHNIPIHLYRRFTYIGLIISILLLFLMFVLGHSLNDAVRWIRIPIIGRTFQPFDFAKVALIMYLAKSLEDGGFDSFKKVAVRLLLPIGIVCLLILNENFSTMALIAATSFCVLFIGGLKGKYLWNIAGIGVACLLVIILFGKQLGLKRSGVWEDRMEAFAAKRDATADRKLTQSEQAQIAVASGGLWGNGPGKSQQRHTLRQSHNDFVYAIIIEEYGIFAGIVLLFFYLWLFYRAVLIAKKCKRVFSSVTVLGLMLIIIFQAMINMGVAVGVFPVTGQTLPLISMGGSSVLFTSMAFGIILAISRAADKQNAGMEEDKLEEDLIEETVVRQEVQAVK